MGIRPKWEFSPTAEFPYLYQLLNGSDLKKVAAILLLALFTFNWFGYRLFINVLEERASLSLQHKLDLDDYDYNRLVEVKIPVSLPYLSNWSNFENYVGETELHGEGKDRRFPTKPGGSGTSTAVLPSVSHRSRARWRVASVAAAGKASSTSFILGTGLKTCSPTKRWAAPLAPARRSTDKDDVVLASSASSPA